VCGSWRIVKVHCTFSAGSESSAENALRHACSDQRISNSVAPLVKHIVGNARSRFTDFLTSDREKVDRFS
jgi:hypothetical protein